jgi:hypothetical protein
MRAKSILLSIILVTGLLLTNQSSSAYSILAHEALIDASWLKSIQPLLKLKYPGATEQQLKEAHAYAYGGSIAPDIGYFPFGKLLFTDLVHYVRSGDFVNALLDDARDINEYAFALGFLCHYMADKYGHSLATNKCVPIVYPEEGKKYGNVVTYEQDHISHKRMEFGFDVLQTVEGDYAAIAYHEFIGFQVSQPLLERAFTEIYGFDINDIFPNLSLSIETLRWSFKRLFPALTRAAWVIKQKEILKRHPTATRRSFTYKRNSKNYFSEFGKKRQKPGIFSDALSLFIRIVPKIGPFRALKFKEPGPVAEKLYIESFDTVMANYAIALKRCGSRTLHLANIDFDTGKPTVPGEYGLADKNYDLLLANINKNDCKLLNDGLKKNVIDFYSTRTVPAGSRKNIRAWAKTMEALQQIKQTNPGPVTTATR